MGPQTGVQTGKFTGNFVRKLGGEGAGEKAPHVLARRGLGVVVVVVGADNPLGGGGRGGLS